MPRVRRCRQPGCHAMVNFPDHYCQQHYEHEAEYLSSRECWARSHDKHYTHKYNTVTRNRDDTKRQQYNFYRTRQWAHLRQQVLDRDHYLCQYCKIIGKLTPNSKTVDHIVPVEAQPNSKADINNLVVTCRQCHHKKTIWEQTYYGTGNGNELTNADPIENIGEIVKLMNDRHL
ncbi:HNH endonuclease [Secundilactobacillus paracollinoides]|uniref:HNH endonuclease n=1 Tax=Secundilactobacillus paracollinoides TaxID=240427 RepID=UPI003F488DFC